MVDEADVCNGAENVPVHFSGDSNWQPKNFEYVCCNIPGPGLDTSMFEDTILGCECDSCDVGLLSTTPQISSDQQKGRDSTTHLETSSPEDTDQCVCISRTNGLAYNKQGQLKDEYFAGQSGVIFECNSSCLCSANCVNRVVQNGLKYKMELFLNSQKGLCLRTIEPILTNTFVCEYAGEVLNSEEASKRFQHQTADDMNYIFILREHFSSGTVVTIVDPKYKGNIGRFLNHSCEPNLQMVPVRVHTMVPKLCLFAKRNIPAGEELTYDYSSGQGTDTVNETLSAKERKSCFCKTKNCKGFLPFDGNAL